MGRREEQPGEYGVTNRRAVGSTKGTEERSREGAQKEQEALHELTRGI